MNCNQCHKKKKLVLFDYTCQNSIPRQTIRQQEELFKQHICNEKTMEHKETNSKPQRQNEIRPPQPIAHTVTNEQKLQLQTFTHDESIQQNQTHETKCIHKSPMKQCKTLQCRAQLFINNAKLHRNQTQKQNETNVHIQTPNRTQKWKQIQQTPQWKQQMASKEKQQMEENAKLEAMLQAKSNSDQVPNFNHLKHFDV